MIIEWLWNQRGFAFPKIVTASSKAKLVVKRKKKNVKKRKR